jgi:hypothetical protein
LGWSVEKVCTGGDGELIIDDLGDGGKKASSKKWKSWSVILTGSQLLFFKDPIWALTLLEQARSSVDQTSSQLLFPRMTSFKPDEVFPVKDCIAVFDRGYAEVCRVYRLC